MAASTKSSRPTLHDELVDILHGRDNDWTTTSELASAVNNRGHYRKKDASSVTAFQIHGRARQYPKLFERDGSRIRLTTGLVATPSDTERRYLMHAWKRDQWKFEQDEGREGVLLDHSASSSAEFGKLHAGDTLYVVGQSEDGRLMLIGRTDVVEVVSQRRAEAKLGYRLYKGTYHALATDGTPRRFDVEIPEKIARAIRSTSRKPIKFDSDVDYRLARNALRPRRWLNEESARLLDDVIATATGGPSKTSERGRTQSRLGIRFVPVQDGHVEGYEMTSPARKRKAVRRERERRSALRCGSALAAVLSIVLTLLMAGVAAGSTNQLALVEGYSTDGNGYDVVVRDAPGVRLVLYVNNRSSSRATVNRHDRATFHEVGLVGVGKLSFSEIVKPASGRLRQKPLSYTRYFQVVNGSVEFLRTKPAKTEPAPSAVPSPEPTTTVPTTPTVPSEPVPSPTCTNGTYVNSAGNTVCKPEEDPSGPPTGATARCQDGTYSFSQSRSGTCSHHRGVAEWLS